MSAQTKIPKVLLVDDDQLITNSLVPLLKDLPCECRVANNWNSAVDVILEAKEGKSQFDLGILDLWVPIAENDQKVDQGPGLAFLLDNVYFQILPPGTPLIVFTNHPTYENCVRCIKAGAIEYLPKVEENVNNTSKLLSLCRKLLFPKFEDDPLTKWVREHAAQLRKRFVGQCVALIPEKIGGSAPREANLDPFALDGYMFLTAQTERELRQKMVRDKVLRWVKPYIVNIARP